MLVGKPIVGLSLTNWRQDPPEKMLPLLAAAGIEATELHLTPVWLDPDRPQEMRRLGRLFAQYRIAPTSVHTQYGDQADVSARNDDWRRAGMELILRGARALWEVGGRIAVLHPGRALADEERPAALAACRRSLAEMIELTADFPVQLAIENMLPGQLGDRGQELVQMAEGFPPGRVAFCLDTGHARLCAEGLEIGRAMAPRLAALHLQDNVGQGDAHLLPFTGTLDWAVVAEILNQADYQGPYLLEIGEAACGNGLSALAPCIQRLAALREEVGGNGPGRPG